MNGGLVAAIFHWIRTRLLENPIFFVIFQEGGGGGGGGPDPLSPPLDPDMSNSYLFSIALISKPSCSANVVPER